MRTKITILAGVLAFGASLGQAATSYLDFNTHSNSPGLVYDGSYAISPYTGTVDGTTVALYCVDFNDTIQFGQQNIAVYTTSITADAATLGAQTRYGITNPSSNSSYASGSTLYEEMAWLATQMQYTGSSNDKAIQEAIWQLTDAPGGSAAPNYSHSNSGSASSGDSGSSQSAAHWIQDAQSYIASYDESTGTSSWSYANHYTNLVLGDWSIITAVNSAGCTTGSHGTLGCDPDGTAGYGSTTQEFLAYKQGGLPGTTGAVPSPAPEPASFFLIGSGLLGAGLISRRRKV